MRNHVRAAGAVLLLAMGCALATSARAQAPVPSWTVNVDVPIDSTFRSKLGGDNGGTPRVQTVTSLSTPGAAVSVTLPYRVGFGAEAYTERLRPPGTPASLVIDLNVLMLNTYLELPVTRWFTFSPGVGWGKGTWALEGHAPDFQAPETVNLWEFFAVAGIRLPWSLQFRLGYHESHSDLINNTGDPAGDRVHKSQPLQMTLLTLGLGYTF